MLGDNVKYEILKLRAVMDPISNTKKMIPSKTYAGRELLSMLEGMVELNRFLVDDQVIRELSFFISRREVVKRGKGFVENT